MVLKLIMERKIVKAKAFIENSLKYFSFIHLLLNRLLVLIIAFLLLTVLLILTKQNFLEIYYILAKSSILTLGGIKSSLRWMTPLLFAGLAVAIAFKGGVFNIGVEGQLYVGAFASTWACITFPFLSKILLIPLSFLAAIIAGSIWAFIPILLKFKFKANEIITSLMLNYIAILFTEWLVRYPYAAPGTAGEAVATVNIPEAAHLAKLMQGSQVTSGLIIGLFLCIIMFLLIKWTKLGYMINQVGTNAIFSKYIGINPARISYIVMIISGSIAGLGGAVEILGVQWRYITKFTIGLGFDGIVVSLLANNNPLGVVIASFFMGALKSGSFGIERRIGASRALVTVLQGIIIALITIQQVYMYRKKEISS